MLDMVYRAEQVKLSQILRRMEDLKRQLDELDRPKIYEDIDPVRLASINLRWETWVFERKKNIMIELANAARDREAQRPKVAEALARREAASKVLKVATSKNELTRSRRFS